VKNLNALITYIAEFRSMRDVFNPWQSRGDGDAQQYPDMERRTRLMQHLRCPDPRLILVGEAPGYQGCRFSGVPFTNEKLLLAGKVPRVGLTQRISIRRLPWCEPSATIMWGALHETGLAAHTVMWNAFAFHPHKPDTPYSNRTPTLAEFRATHDILRGVIDLYPGCAVVAVGQKAFQSLDWLDVKLAATVRHPSMGGANDFRAGLKRFAQTV
jgi:uracil-DNA glycosylase